ncbi:MAG: hypothetical protein LBD98_05360 [Endomicrobium sp.]|jgi:hypothetical protein|nr:hypothetical protein [Endomicrobium sp.]
MNRAKKALVSTVLSISLLLLASNCFAGTNIPAATIGQIKQLMYAKL